MIFKKNIRFFSTMFLIISVIFSIQAGNAVFAEETPQGEAPNPNAADSTALGGIAHLPSQKIISEAVYVFNVEADIPVFQKNADKKVYPASTAKIMTVLITLENADLEDFVTVTSAMDNEFTLGNPNMPSYDIAKAGFVVGQQNLTVREVLYGLMLPSGCDAANILANHVGDGNASKFIDMMNEKAEKIGMKSSRFSNAHGLFDEGTYSTAYDMFLLTQYVLKHHEIFFLELVGTIEYPVPITSLNPNGSLVNTNQLLRQSSPYFYEGALGIKTGGYHEYFLRTPDGSGNVRDGQWKKIGGESGTGITNLVSLARRNDFTYIIVTMHAPWTFSYERAQNETGLHLAYHDHIRLYNWAFATFENTRIMQKTDPIDSISVVDGDGKDSLVLFPHMTEDFWALLPKGIDVKSVVEPIVRISDREVPAPIEQGAVLGTIELKLANQSLGTWDLVTNEGVERSQTARTRDRLSDLFGSWWFVPSLIVLGVLIIALIVLSYVRRHRKLQRERFGRGSNKYSYKSKRKPPNRKIRR
jgi:D-alanyl-D-alanine carboxypeptidase (penicillin-binding protein 5/6)